MICFAGLLQVCLLALGALNTGVIAIELNCTSYSNYFGAQDLDFHLSRDDVVTKNCSFRSEQYVNLRIPTLRITNVGLTGNNSIRIWQSTQLGGAQYALILNSSNCQDTVIELLPAYTQIDFYIIHNTQSDFFHLQLSYRNVTPKYSLYPGDLNSGYPLVADSVNYPPNTMIRHQSGWYLQLVVFNETVDVSVLKRFFVYTDYTISLFQGTLYDVWKAGQLGQASLTSFAAILNINPTPIDGFAVLFSKTNQNSFVQPFKGGLTRLSSPNASAIFLEVSNRFYDPKIPTNFHDISLTGSGTVLVYGGCVTQLLGSDLIANISSQNQANYENLSVYGRCRTYVVNRADVQWRLVNSVEPTEPSRIGQHGVIMSYNYPLTENSTYTVTKTIEPPKGAKQYSVTYSKLNGFDDVVVEADGKSSIISWRDAPTISSKSHQVVSFNVTAGRSGDLVLYTVTSSTIVTRNMLSVLEMMENVDRWYYKEVKGLAIVIQAGALAFSRLKAVGKPVAECQEKEPVADFEEQNISQEWIDYDSDVSYEEHNPIAERSDREPAEGGQRFCSDDNTSSSMIFRSSRSSSSSQSDESFYPNKPPATPSVSRMSNDLDANEILENSRSRLNQVHLHNAGQFLAYLEERAEEMSDLSSFSDGDQADCESSEYMTDDNQSVQSLSDIPEEDELSDQEDLNVEANHSPEFPDRNVLGERRDNAQVREESRDSSSDSSMNWEHDKRLRPSESSGANHLFVEQRKHFQHMAQPVAHPEINAPSTSSAPVQVVPQVSVQSIAPPEVPVEVVDEEQDENQRPIEVDRNNNELLA